MCEDITASIGQSQSRQVRVNWIMFRLRRFARHSCISYWQRIITASGQFAVRCKSLPLHFRENLYRKYAEEGTTGRPLSSPALSLIFSRPTVIGIIARQHWETFQFRVCKKQCTTRLQNDNDDACGCRVHFAAARKISPTRLYWKIDTQHG